MIRWGADARCRAALGLRALALAALLLAGPAGAEEPPAAQVFCTRYREFRIPFKVDPDERRIVSVRLYVSENQGRTWQQAATSQPSSGDASFGYTADHDGWYWFTVQTVDRENRLHPPVMDERAPVQLKVCVDTRPPTIAMQALAGGEGSLGVRWVIQDDNLNNLRQNKADTLLLEYRPQGGTRWARLSAEQKAAGQCVLPADAKTPVEVRLSVLDDAGNEGRKTIVLGAGGTVLAGGENDPAPPRRAGPEGRRLVNTQRIKLNYDVQDVGKSGISEVELWSTDGKVWKRESSEKDPQPPYAYTVELVSEGVYGFTLVARSGVGLGEQPPKVGDPPQIWIEADWTKPKVSIHSVRVGEGIDTGSLFITYTAEDKNLDRDGSITLSYAERPDGPWTVFAGGQDCTGRYVWRMPPTVPLLFYVRVEATDRAGNVGRADTSEPVKVDLNRPKARVVTVEPIKQP